ncbi:MAG: hypothetical protein KC502_15890 [Myxococcales bacterium]|nr:hypothetical protein [Myxococcales bacterium]
MSSQPSPQPSDVIPWTRWLTFSLAVSSALLALPLFSGTYLPYLDLPQHVGAVSILADGDPAFRFSHYYSVDLLGSPYLLPYLIATGLAWVFGPALAVKLLFALAAVSLPWAMAWAAHRFGRDPAVGLLAAPFAFGTFAFMGFLNFVLSFPLFLLWIGWWRGAVSAPKFGVSQWLVGGLLSITLFYGHVMTFGFAAGACGLIALLAETPGEGHRPWPALATRLLRGLHFLPGVLLFGAWSMWSGTASKGELGRMVGKAIANEAPRWDGHLDRLKVLLDYSLSVYPDASDEWLLFGWLLAVIVFALLCRRTAVIGTRAHFRAGLLPGLLVLSALTLGLLMPANYRGIWPIAARMAPLLALLVLLLPRGRVVWAPAALVLGLGLTGATSYVHAQHIEDFQAEVGPLGEVIEPIDKGARVMTLIWDRGSRIVRWPAFMHYSQYVLAERGGVSEFSFVNFTKSPIHYVEDHAPLRLPARFEWMPHAYNHARDGDWYTYVLMRDGGRTRAHQSFRGGPQMRLVKRAGPWALYEKAHQPKATADSARLPKEATAGLHPAAAQ